MNEREKERRAYRLDAQVVSVDIVVLVGSVREYRFHVDEWFLAEREGVDAGRDRRMEISDGVQTLSQFGGNRLASLRAWRPCASV